jgi:Flp pilus assembly protein CpaB
VKKQTLILVMIGVILFIAGSAIAYASVRGAAKHASAGSTVVPPVSTSAVVAKANIPAGTTGQAMVSGGMVALELIPTKTYIPADLGTLSALNDEVLKTSIAKGHAINSAELTASTSSISLPTGLDGVTVTVSGTAGLAGYLQPGSRVDVYANITKPATVNGQAVGLSATLPLPCTELAMANIEVLDVESTVPSYSSHPTAAGRTIPASETLLLAVNPADARSIEFLSQNQTVTAVQTQKDTNPPPLGACISTNQTAALP